ncbi:response regulator transcription factor [Streptomyces sp. NBC_01261]|uniref:response regulator transcription factor n=1 Tax=unclassified Streptomyces TaxID=2593676 RepID=UPI002E2C7E3D|nr:MULTISPECIES: response regulator transcription factor [unclassified Streptomyces]
MRVLVVEDHTELADSITRVFRREGLAVDTAYDGRTALDLAIDVDYDVVVLDRDLPDVHGDEVCAELTAEGVRTKVLMLTASASIADRVEGLGLGADDYLPKPFAWAELLARTRALGRRAHPVRQPVLARGTLLLDPARRTASHAGTQLPLTAKEFGVLAYLLGAEGRTVPADELLAKVWDEVTDPGTTTVKATVNRLRTKLVDRSVIQTVPGEGYRI